MKNGVREISRFSSPELTSREMKDLRVLALFTEFYCRSLHDGEKEPLRDCSLPGRAFRKIRLCSECREFLFYAVNRRIRCPLDPKPACKHCHIHCYRPGHREKVREIMRFSGKRLIRRGRLDLLWHYLF
jgi:hypothetical protein